MKVKELIIKLENLDQDKEIFCYNEEYGEDEPITSIYQNKDGSYYITGSC